MTAAVLTAITITSADLSPVERTYENLTATRTFSDGTTEDLTDQASWTSNPGNIAQVENGLNGGLVLCLGVGSATITATLDGVKGSITLNVIAKTLTKIRFKFGSNQTVNQGGTKQLFAIAFFSNGSFQDITASATWTSSDTAIATVGSSGNQNGLVSGVAVGIATITAKQSGITGAATVTVVLPP